MSFRGELKGFAEGLKAGQDFWNRDTTRRYNEALTQRIRKPGDDDLGVLPDPLGGGGGGVSVTTNPTGDTSTSSSTGPAETIDKGAFLGKAYDYYRSKGLGHAQAAAIAGNLQMESGGDPRVFAGVRRGDRGTAGYAAQWRDKRLANLEAFAKSRDHPKPTLADQFDFVLEEGNAKSPYRDQVWASKMPGFMAAKTPEEAATLFMNGFERPNADPKVNGITKRIGWAKSLGDSGGAAPVSADTGTTSTASAGSGLDTSVADSSGDNARGLLDSEGDQQTASADGTRYSPRTGIEMPDWIRSSAGQAPQVSLGSGTLASLGAPSVPYGADALDLIRAANEAGPAIPQNSVWVARGGTIPGRTPAPRRRPQVQYLAAGGLPNTPPAIDYTQAPPPTAPVKPVTVAPLTPAGPTASQLAFRKLNQPKPVVPPPVAPKPATPAAPTQSWIQMGPGGYDGGGNGTGGNASSMVWRMDPISGKRRAMPKGAHFVNQKLMTQYPNLVMPGLFRYQDGGAIPEPGEQPQPVQMFARGGAVEGDDDGYFTRRTPKARDRDERFQQLLKEENRRPQNRGGGDNARDRAARRLSAEEGRPSSTAYSPGRGRRHTAAPGGGGGGLPGEAPRPAPRPEPALLEDRLTRERRPAPGSNAELLEDRTTRERRPTSELADPHTNMTPSVIPEPPTTPPPAKPGTPGPGTPRWELDPRSPDLPREDPNRPLPFKPGLQPDSLIGTAVQNLPPAAPDTLIGDWQRQVTPSRPPDNVGINPTIPAPAPVVAPPPAPPIIPDQIDLRPAPVSVAPAAPAGPTPVDHARLLQGATEALAKGGDPKRIGDLLFNAGIPQELWPLELQNSYLGFAEGGMIPEPGQRGYNEAVASGQTATRQVGGQGTADVSATPKLLSHVGKALDGGIKFLVREFGLGGEGAVPSPADAGAMDSGADRLGRGEGAATREEIAGVDDHVDPDRQLNEGDRQLMRLAKTTQWYLSQGRKDEAEASAGSLLQYGAQRFSQLGSGAQTAYEKYLQDGDPKNLDNMTKYLEQAYRLIPDGARLDVNVDPNTHRMTVTRIDADGNEQDVPVSPDQLPALIRSVRDGSAYWSQVQRLADPAAAKTAESRRYEEGKTAEQRRYDEQKASETSKTKTAETLGREDRSNKEYDRRRAEERKYKEEHPTTSAAGVDEETFNNAWSEADEAQQALKAYKNSDDAPEDLESDPEFQRLQSEYNSAASRFADTIPFSRRSLELQRYGFENFTYTGNEAPGEPTTAEPATAQPAAQPAAAAPGPPPAKYPDAQWVEGEWRVVRNGKEFRLKPKGG